MLVRCSIIIGLSLVNPLASASPPEAAAAADADSRKLLPEIAQRTLYLDVSFEREDRKAELYNALAYHCNGLSRAADPGRLRPVPEVNPVVMAANIDDFAWDTKVLTALLYNIEADECYFSVTRPGSDGKTLTKVWAPWVPYKANDKVPFFGIVNAGWFINRTGIQEDRDGFGYYDMLGIGKKETDFQARIAADPELAKKHHKEMAAIVGRSIVTKNNRSMTRLETINGPYWFTQDYKKSKGKQNVIRLPDGQAVPPRGDATEQYGTLPNGLFCFYLGNADGDRQNVAPANIAGDQHAHNTGDMQVHVGLSCIRCHVEGIRPINDWARSTYEAGSGRKAAEVDYAAKLRFQQLYLSDLSGRIKKDQAGYAEALQRVNGLTPAANATAYANVFARYEADMGLEDVARELGVTQERLVKVLSTTPADAAANKFTLLDPIIVSLIPKLPKNGEREGPRDVVRIRRDHFEEQVEALYDALNRGKP